MGPCGDFDHANTCGCFDKPWGSVQGIIPDVLVKAASCRLIYSEDAFAVSKTTGLRCRSSHLSCQHKFILLTMTVPSSTTIDKLGHYRRWVNVWRTVKPSALPAEHCLEVVTKEGPLWIHTSDASSSDDERLHHLASCFKKAAKARSILFGGKVPPTCDECDVLSETYEARVECHCSGLYPIQNDLSLDDLLICGCKAIQHMISMGVLVSSKENEWDSSTVFSSKGLFSAMTELALCHSDIRPSPFSCRGEQGDWPDVKAPDRKPNQAIDLDEEIYDDMFPTAERIRLSADAKHFFAVASGVSRIDLGIQMAIADSGNDILIGDYCEAAIDECLTMLRTDGAAAFSFLKLCVYSGLMTDWHFDHLVAQTIQFSIISYWRDHSRSRPTGVYGSRMTGMEVHRHIDLGMTVGIVTASIASGQTMDAEEYRDLVDTTVLISDLVDFRGDTWRNQRENVVLRRVRGCLCSYLDELISRCVGGSAALINRGDIFALVIVCFCSWMLMSSGHKIYETLHGAHLISKDDQTCAYGSATDGVYEELLKALHPYGSLGERGPSIRTKRKDLQTLYAKYKASPDDHIKWAAGVTRIVLHPVTFRRLVDVVHYQLTGELGDTDYCA